MKKYLLYILTILFLMPQGLFAQTDKQDTVYKGVVLEIIEEREISFSENEKTIQQNIRFEISKGPNMGQEGIFYGIDSFDVINKHLYKVGDKVLIAASRDDSGEVNYYIIDFVRNQSLGWLFFIFALSLILVGGLKGIRALISLGLSFFIIVYYIIPQILSGADAITVTILGSIAILFSVIYLTEGFNKLSHVASLSVFISLIFTMVVAWLFVSLAKLSGLGSEETAFLINLGDVSINFTGLLLAGIIVGTLGVLDDVVISQVASVEQIYSANENQSPRAVFTKAYKIGVSHISSMANTLFLAYAGASFPLLILFFSGQSAFSGFFDVVNNEAIATEIVRTLAGSIGLVFAVPLSTWLAVVFLRR